MMPALLAVAAQESTDSGFSVGTLLLFIGGAILLAFFCSIGVIARMRENRIEARREAGRLTEKSGPAAIPIAPPTEPTEPTQSTQSIQPTQPPN